MSAFLRRALAEPGTRGLDLDAPSTTGERRRVVARKRLLREVYAEWHRKVTDAIPPPPGRVLELGAGAAVFPHLPGLLRSEVFWCPWVDLAADGQRLPFAAGALRGIAMVNVLHHLPAPAGFLAEAARCTRVGGVVAMVEPWVSPWSRLIYGHFHPEPFAPESGSWETRGRGPLTRANGALPWILFHRDRAALADRLPQWRLRAVELQLGLRFLFSGGLSIRSLAPSWSGGFWTAAERVGERWRERLAMFALIVLERQATDASGHEETR
jgi:SAM-dependent methyltransferase